MVIRNGSLKITKNEYGNTLGSAEGQNTRHALHRRQTLEMEVQQALSEKDVCVSVHEKLVCSLVFLFKGSILQVQFASVIANVCFPIANI